jgi:ABC-2 type transport system permease protein
VAEKLLVIIPGIGEQLQAWLPFTAAHTFLTGGAPSGQGTGAPVTGVGESPWMALAYFAAICVGTMVIALFVADRRDA